MDRILRQDPDHFYLYIWKFQVTPNKETEFQRMYGPEGEWVNLFRRGAGYKRTLLLKDLDTPYSYTTVDMWESESAYKHFKKEFAAEFDILDEYCEHLTESEALVGRFETIDQR